MKITYCCLFVVITVINIIFRENCLFLPLLMLLLLLLFLFFRENYLFLPLLLLLLLLSMICVKTLM